MRQVKRIIIYFLGVAAILATGIFAGIRYEQYQQAKRERLEEHVDVIAVVNMDEGITQGEEQINYASQLMQMPGENYVTTGLNEAKAGIGNGTYAAYIVIPEDFSESVVSVEGNPQKILLEYAFNQRLDADTKERAMNDVYAFETTLNTNIAYMYIDAIMTAFHDVQDDASTILKSDAAELTQLCDVNAGELIVPMEQPTLQQVENTIVPVNLEPYLSENTTLLDNMLQEFDNSIRQGMDEFATVQTGHQSVTQATETFFSTYGIVLADTAVRNSEIAADGRLNLEEAIALFNEDVDADIPAMEAQLAALVETQRTADETAANIQHETVIAQLTQEYDGELDELQKEWETVYEAWCNYTKRISTERGTELRGAWQDELDASLEDLLKTAYHQGAVEALDAVEQNVATLPDAGDSGDGGDTGGVGAGGDTGAGENTGEGEITGAGENAGNAGNTDTGGDQTTGGGQGTGEPSYTAAQIQSVCDAIEGELDIKAEEYLTSQGENVKIVLSEDTLENFSIDLANAVDEEGNPIEPPTPERNTGDGTDTVDEADSTEEDAPSGIVLETAKDSDAQAVSETAAGFAGMFALEEDRQAISDMIQGDFVEKLTTEGEKQMKRLSDSEEDMSGAIEDYERSLLAYDPFEYLEPSNMTAYLSDIGTNASDMLTDVEKNNLEYTKFADDVYIKAMEDVGLMQEAYRDAGEQTAGNVESCIGTLQASRSEVNGQNTDMLERFSLLLPYTRVGSQASPEVYEHIVNPVVSAENGSNAWQDRSDETQQIPIADIITMLILAGIFVCVFIILSSTAHRIREKHETEETA